MDAHAESNARDVAERYVAVWNEADPQRRRAQIEALWTPDGVHISPSYEVRGYAELEERVRNAHDRWVASEGFVFRLHNEPAAHHCVIKLRWEMIPAPGGAAESLGVDFILLDGDRIRAVYQFIES